MGQATAALELSKKLRGEASGKEQELKTAVEKAAAVVQPLQGEYLEKSEQAEESAKKQQMLSSEVKLAEQNLRFKQRTEARTEDEKVEADARKKAALEAVVATKIEVKKYD